MIGNFAYAKKTTECKPASNTSLLEVKKLVNKYKKLTSNQNTIYFEVTLSSDNERAQLKSDPKALRKKYLDLFSKAFTQMGCTSIDANIKDLQGVVINEKEDSINENSFTVTFGSTNCRTADIPVEQYICKTGETIKELPSVQDQYYVEPSFFCVR